MRILLLLLVLSLTPAALAQESYTPKTGQEGTDSVWVPAPPEMVEKMLDLANVTADDYVMGPGSGDGRMVIALENSPRAGR